MSIWNHQLPSIRHRFDTAIQTSTDALTMQFQVLTFLARENVPATLLRPILEGRLREAATLAEEALERARLAADRDRDRATCELAQLCADLMLALDRAEEAEETHRLAVRLAGSAHRGAVRVVSCRTAGLLSLYRQRYGTAAACFSRLVADDAASVAQRVEALCGLAMAKHAVGLGTATFQALDEAGRLAVESSNADLSMLVSLVRVELAVHREIRAHDQLHDHVFWQPAAADRVRSMEDVQPIAAIEICLAAHGRHRLVQSRLTFLRDLLRACYGQPRLLPELASHVAQLRATGVAALEHQARIDSALVALAQGQADVARGLLEPLQVRGGAARQRGDMELAFCQARLNTLGGRADEAMQHYRRYALAAMELVRIAATLAGRDPSMEPGAPAPSRDDVEMRLPAKYRKAYRYLQAHLDCAELSVREIADDMGVTERALQTAFKTHLGMTPGELVQRCRVERIRADLLRTDAPTISVLETAARWGIRNRSTLITSYRKYFSETPTQTLARRAAAI
jgi:AraC-like DNA-binding protein